MTVHDAVGRTKLPAAEQVHRIQRANPVPPVAQVANDAHGRAIAFGVLSRELRFILDSQGRMHQLDGPWESVLGRTPQQLCGTPWEAIVRRSDHLRMREALAGLSCSALWPREIELRFSDSRGGHRTLGVAMAAGGGEDAVVAVGRDRTEELRSAQRSSRALARQQRRVKGLTARIKVLEARSAATEYFAATAAHQLSEPLIIAESSAIALSEQLAGWMGLDLRDQLDAIGRTAAHARLLVDALLQEARSAGEPLELCPVDTASVVHAALQQLRPRFDERAAGALVGPLPSLQSDPSLLAVVFQNLLSNALKYGPRAGGEVRITAERIGRDWRFEVTSGGLPITSDEALRIFEPFRRIPGERRAPGNGLGLAICARLVTRLGGTIGVRPGRANGNVFYFVLPQSS